MAELFLNEKGRSGLDSMFSRRWMLYIAVGQFLLCAVLIALVSEFPRQGNYSFISAAIRHWDFRAVPPDQPREFWGISYLAAAVASITRLSDATAILIIDFCAYLLAIFLCDKLWGAMIAAWFMAINWYWLDTSVAGGSEPLFMALLLGSFIAIRKERWMLATTLASCASIVRPVAVFALVAIGLVLLKRGDIRRFLCAISIGAATGVVYLIPIFLVYGDPLSNIRSYQQQDWAGTLPITIPLWPLIKGAMFTNHTMRLPLKLLIAFWVIVTVAGMVRFSFSRPLARYMKDHPVEAIFAALYTVFLFSYNTNFWVWQHFPRFVIPLLPFILLAFRERLSEKRSLLCAVAMASIICVILPKAGIETVSTAIHKLIKPNDKQRRHETINQFEQIYPDRCRTALPRRSTSGEAI